MKVSSAPVRPIVLYNNVCSHPGYLINIKWFMDFPLPPNCTSATRLNPLIIYRVNL